VADLLIESVAPTRCVVCEQPGTLLCERCASQLVAIDPEAACPVCGAPFGRVSCTECMRPDGPLVHAFDSARARYVFDDTSSRLVKAFKDEGERRLASMIAQRMVEAAGEKSISADLAIPIPATRAALRRRGFDHMALVAEEFSRLTGVPQRGCLAKSGSRDQRTLSREDRLANMAGVFAVESREDATYLKVAKPRVLLLDDVFTTGATLDSAAAFLKRAGASHVDVVVLCRVW